MLKKLLVAIGVVVVVGLSSGSAMAMNFFDAANGWTGFGVDAAGNETDGVGFKYISPSTVELKADSVYQMVAFESGIFTAPQILTFDFIWQGTTAAFGGNLRNSDAFYDSSVDGPIFHRHYTVSPGDKFGFYVANFDGMEGSQDTLRITATPTPIPAPMILFGSGLAGLQFLRFRKWRK